MKKVFLTFFVMMISGFTSANPLGGNPTNGYCQTVDSSACGWNSGSSSSRQVYKVPNRWGAIYFNPVNRAVGYSENNTEGERSARREALASCIKAGGGQNPIARDGKGCRLKHEYRNLCAAIAVGGKEEGKGGTGTAGDKDVEVAKELALKGCSKHSNECVIRYSGCSRHPDYRY
jgi:hypothetical protein|nr:DUF4189 domain-containing protein [uncultured Neisseria sp.]